MSSLIKKVPSSNGYDLFNGDFEEGIKHYRTYKDSQVASPEDGIGGTPQYVSITASNVNPLLGNNSGIISKSLGNGQGEGVSIDFELSDGVLNNNALLSFIYTTSNDYVTGDIKLFLYDITNSLVYNISDTDLSSSVNVSKHEANIWFNATSKKYRLIFHIASTNTNAYTVKLDDVKINNEVKVIGSVISEWNSYTPTFEGLGTVTGINARWRRVGGSIEIMLRCQVGTVQASQMRISLPSGLVIGGISTLEVVGIGVRNASPNYTINALAKAGFTYLTFSANNTNSFVELNGNAIIGSNELFSMNASVPISGWGSNTNLITDFQEFASNSSTADANDLTSFANGPEGSSALFTFTGARIRRVRFRNPIQPTDKIVVELYNSPTNQWLDASNTFLRINGVDIVSNGAGTSGIGIIGNSSSIPNTDFDVMFFTYRSGTSHWSVGTGLLKWRVRKISNGNSAESIPSGIYESGSNANGSWIKYIDGTMECWGTLPSFAVTGTVLAGQIHYSDRGPFSFPQTFSNTPTVSITINNSSARSWVSGPTALTNSTFNYTALASSSAVNITEGSYHAIGKWNNALQVYAPGALVGITIEESGSNSNGSYIKYSDGTMLCYGYLPPVAVGTPSKNLPASYLSISSFSISGAVKPIGTHAFFEAWPISAISFAYYSVNASNDYTWMSIGRWK